MVVVKITESADTLRERERVLALLGSYAEQLQALGRELDSAGQPAWGVSAQLDAVRVIRSAVQEPLQ